MSNSESESVCVSVPLGGKREGDLVNALDYVMYVFGIGTPGDGLDFSAQQRAADWLHAKYGSDND